MDVTEFLLSKVGKGIDSSASDLPSFVLEVEVDEPVIDVASDKRECAGLGGLRHIVHEAFAIRLALRSLNSRNEEAEVWHIAKSCFSRIEQLDCICPA